MAFPDLLCSDQTPPPNPKSRSPKKVSSRLQIAPGFPDRSLHIFALVISSKEKTAACPILYPAPRSHRGSSTRQTISRCRGSVASPSDASRPQQPPQACAEESTASPHPSRGPVPPPMTHSTTKQIRVSRLASS